MSVFTKVEIDLPAFLDQQLKNIVSCWAEKIRILITANPMEKTSRNILRPEGLLEEERFVQWLNCIVRSIGESAYEDLDACFKEISQAFMRSGVDIGQTTESLLLCKEAIIEVLLTSYSSKPASIWPVSSALDAWMRGMIGHFNTIYADEMNRSLQNQQIRTAMMLQVTQQATSSLKMEVVLQQIAKGITTALGVPHCNFYIVNESQTQLIPMQGHDEVPLPSEIMHIFLNQPIPLDDDFVLGILKKREPFVTYDAQNDTRVDKGIVGPVHVKSVLSIPMIVHDHFLALAMIGTFTDYHVYTNEEIELATGIANAAGLAIENARLHRQVQYLAVMQERERLSREMHDNLAQSLSALKLHASYISELLSSGEVGRAQETLTDLTTILSETNADVRDVIFSLRSSATSDLEFLPTLRAYLDRCCKIFGMNVRLTIPKDAVVLLPPDIGLQTIRIVQEAMTNVRKHANASIVHVNLDIQPEMLSITLEDDGRGFDPTEIPEKACGGVGLQIMRERAESVAGAFQVHSQPGQGTRVSLQVPLISPR